MAECMRNAFSPCRSEAAAYNTMVTRVRSECAAARRERTSGDGAAVLHLLVPFVALASVQMVY
jgi:hypothetical protein